MYIEKNLHAIKVVKEVYTAIVKKTFRDAVADKLSIVTAHLAMKRYFQ
jgi:hypothetical protein